MCLHVTAALKRECLYNIFMNSSLLKRERADRLIRKYEALNPSATNLNCIDWIIFMPVTAVKTKFSS